MIGVANRAGEDLKEVSSENIVALCDVDWGYAAKTFEKYPNAKRYKDFREMLDKEKGIDAVVVGTPDHAHAIVSKPFARAQLIATETTRSLNELVGFMLSFFR